ncbi:unnamed protein product, partial [Linum tenue]
FRLGSHDSLLHGNETNHPFPLTPLARKIKTGNEGGDKDGIVRSGMSPSTVSVHCESLRLIDIGEDSNGVYFRRMKMIVSLSTLPLLVGLQESLDGFNVAIAAESGESGYLLVKE